MKTAPFPGVGLTLAVGRVCRQALHEARGGNDGLCGGVGRIQRIHPDSYTTTWCGGNPGDITTLTRSGREKFRHSRVASACFILLPPFIHPNSNSTDLGVIVLPCRSNIAMSRLAPLWQSFLILTSVFA